MKFFMFLIFLSFFAFSHPHVFVDVKPEIIFKKSSLEIKVNWLLDELTSEQIISQHDKNHNRKFEPKESKILFNTTFQFLKKYKFFTKLIINKVPTLFIVKKFNAQILNNKVHYIFSLIPNKQFKDDDLFIKLIFLDSTNFTAFTAIGDVKYSKNLKLIKKNIIKLKCTYEMFFLKGVS